MFSSNSPRIFDFFQINIAFFPRIIFFHMESFVSYSSLYNEYADPSECKRQKIYYYNSYIFHGRVIYDARAHCARIFTISWLVFFIFISSFIYSDNFLVMIRFSHMIRCVTAKICQSGLVLSNGLSLEVKKMLEKNLD